MRAKRDGSWRGIADFCCFAVPSVCRRRKENGRRLVDASIARGPRRRLARFRRRGSHRETAGTAMVNAMKTSRTNEGLYFDNLEALG